MATKPLAYDDFSVGYAFPPHGYRVDAGDNDAFVNTFDHSPVQDATGDVVLPPKHRPTVRAVHPTLVGSYQPMHACFEWPVGVLHAKEKVSLRMPVYPGESLESVVAVKDKYVKNEKRFVVLEITVQKKEIGKIALVVERTLMWPN